MAAAAHYPYPSAGYDPRVRVGGGAGGNYYDDYMRVYRHNLPGQVYVGADGSGAPVPDDFMLGAGLKWTHTDSRGMEMAVASGIARAQKRDWMSDGAVADLRGLIVGAFALYNTLSGVVDISTDGIEQIGVRTDQDFGGDANRHELALCGPRLLMAAASLSAKIAPTTGQNMPTSAMTVDGGAASDMTIHPVPGVGGGTTVGFGWPAAVVVIVAIGGAIYLGERALDIYNQHVLRDDNVAALVAAAGKAVEVAKNHAEAEAKAGKQIPLNPAEVAIVQSLNKTAETTSKANDISLQPKLSSVFPDTTKIADTAIKTTGAVLSIGTALAVAAAAVVAVIALPRVLPPAHEGG